MERTDATDSSSPIFYHENRCIGHQDTQARNMSAIEGLRLTERKSKTHPFKSKFNCFSPMFSISGMCIIRRCLEAILHPGSIASGLLKLKKTINVVMAAYNGAPFIKEQIDSILAQSVRPNKIIVSDDCSDDNTYEILKDYSAKYNFIKVYRNEKNIGYAKNFKKVLSLCDSDYIALSDQDDRWLPNKLEVCLNALIKGNSKKNIICYHDAYLMLENGSQLEDVTYYSLVNQKKSLSPEELILNLFRYGGVFMPGFTLFFDSCFARKYYDILSTRKHNSHDWSLCSLYCSFTSPVFIEEPLAYYRLHKQQASGAMDCLLENTKYEPVKKRKLIQSISAEWKRFINRSYNKKHERIENKERLIDRLLALECLSQIIKTDNEYININRKQDILALLDTAIDEICFQLCHT